MCFMVIIIILERLEAVAGDTPRKDENNSILILKFICDAYFYKIQSFVTNM